MTKVILDSYKIFTGLGSKKEQIIKEDLTLENMAYHNARKYSKYSNTNIPKYLFYYKQNKKELLVPRGYNPPFDVEVIEDRRIEVTVDYPRLRIDLRDSQKEAKARYLDDPDTNSIITLPTGKGKSILGLSIAHSLRQKVLIIVHKQDLVDGWTQDAKVCFGEDIEVGRIQGKKKVIGEQVTVATIQTLNRQSEEYLESLYNEFGMIIVDELHHAGSKSYELVNNFKGVYRLGLTATLERSDKLESVIHFMFGGIAYKYEIQEDEKDILPVTVYLKNSNVDYEPRYVRNRNKWELIPYDVDAINYSYLSEIPFKDKPRVDFHDIDNAIVMNKNYTLQVCKDINREYSKGRNCIVFFSKKAHIDHYYDILSSIIDPSRIQKYYGDAKESKDEMKRKAESGEVLVTLATYSIATEGTNVKAWQTAFLVSSMNNAKNTEQAVGRVRRTISGSNKTMSYVYDYHHPKVGVVSRHINTRLMRYNKLKLNIVGDKYSTVKNGYSSPMLSRGFI